MIKWHWYHLLPALAPLAYAETHYRFRYFFSWLRKPEPELIFDIPSRCKQGTDFPVLLIIKDADAYPVDIFKIEIFNNGSLVFKSDEKYRVQKPYAEKLFRIPSDKLATGKQALDCVLHYESGLGQKICRNDNHRMTSHNPLKTYISEDELPRIDDCVFGETHSHSNYTSDQVEFGASLTGTAVLAKAMNLDFFCVTDHSYDLDDMPDDYLKNDPKLRKWTNFLTEVKRHNHGTDKILIIPGEEITVRNSLGKNIHFLLYNNQRFFKGSGDGAEQWFKTRSEHAIADVLNSMDETALAFAAHPAESVPYLQQIFINRGNWRTEDFSNPKLDGMQCINGAPAALDKIGKALWVDQLLSGRRLVAIAGNDAHGNFASFRQIGFPFFTMRENDYHLFGVWRTGVFLDGLPATITTVLEKIKSGNCFLTNGPALRLNANRSGNLKYQITIQARSGKEFGSLKTVKIIVGYCDTGKEEPLSTFSCQPGFFTEHSIPIEGSADYVRAEVTTSQRKMGISNAIWLDTL